MADYTTEIQQRGTLAPVARALEAVNFEVCMGRILFLVLVLAFFPGAATVLPLSAFHAQGTTRARPTATLAIEDTLAELNKRFTVRGQPVHPGLIERFTRWLSDSSEPVVISVDALAAAGSNEYFEDAMKVERSGVVTLTKAEGSFSYKWLGTVSPGLHVVQTAASGGGSGVFETLYVLRASAGTGQSPDGAYPQLLLSVVQFFILGDRDDATVTVRPNSITIGTSRYRTKPVTLHFK